MSVSPHHDEEALIALLDRPRGAWNDEHVASCPACREALDSYRSIIDTLGEKPVWNFGRIIDEPVKKTITALRAAAASMRSEDEVAEALFAELTAGPREQWTPRLMADAKYRTAAVARRLSVASEAVAFKSPADDLELTRLATDIADHLDEAVAPSTVAQVRGCAWRDRAFALNYSGDSTAALQAIAIAEKHFAGLPISDYEIGRLELTKADIFRALDRFSDGLKSVAVASRVFSDAADVERLRTARSIKAHLLYCAGDMKRALLEWQQLAAEMSETDPMRAGVLHNIAWVYREMGASSDALDYMRQAVDGFAQNRATTDLLKARWNVASLLKSQQRFEAAEQVLREVIAGFDQLQMREDVVLARLDVAEVLIIGNRFEEAVEICHVAIEELRAAGLEHTLRALTAVSFLSEAMVARKATPVLVRHVRDFVRDVRNQPTLLFAPPPL